MNKLNSKARGFTLLELLLVIAIISVLAGLVIFNLRPADVLTDLKEVERSVDKESLKKAIEVYNTSISLQGGTPLLSSVADGVYDICTEGASNCTADSISIDSLITAGILSEVPVDPECSSTTDSCYNIKTTNGGLNVSVFDENDFPNLLLDKPIVFSQGQVDYLNYAIIYSVDNSNDGDAATGWRTQTDHTSSSERTIVVIDMQKTESIERLEYYAAWDPLPAFNDGVTIRFSISPDNSMWTQINEKRLTGTQNGALQNDVLASTATGRYLRMEYIVDGNWSGWGNIQEIRAFEH